MPGHRAPDRKTQRAALLEQRAALAPSAVMRASESAARRAIALPELTVANRIAAYRAVRGEIDCAPIVQWAWQSGRRVYLPVTRPPRTMVFARWRHDDEFLTSSFGIAEPLPTAQRIAATRLDVVLVPLVAFDHDGHRLGHGAGYYDATFEFRRNRRRTRPLLVGLAHPFQELEHIDEQEWDVSLDIVVTAQETLRVRR